jgi:hypothetical protein
MTQGKLPDTTNHDPSAQTSQSPLNQISAHSYNIHIMHVNNFDFVVFDWKGTLEPKLGGKAIREQNAISEIAKTFQDPDQANAFLTYFNEEKLIATQKEKEHIFVTKTKLLENVLDRLKIHNQDQRKDIIDVIYCLCRIC